MWELSPILMGKALDAYRSIRSKQDMCNFKLAFLLKLELAPEAYRRKFQGVQKRSDINYSEVTV